MWKTILELVISCHKLALSIKKPFMLHLENDMEWVVKCIHSCNTTSQIESCRELISIFVGKMAIQKIDTSEIRKVEDALLDELISREAQIFIP
jgi:hypothetical protein